MPIFSKLQNDLKAALSQGDKFKVSVLRMLVGAVRNREIELRKAGERQELPDEEVIKVIRQEIKKRRDALAIYQDGGRDDLAKKEAGEIKILEQYLPTQLSEAQIEAKVRQIKHSMGEQAAFGPLMGRVMAELKGQADGAVVAQVVKKVLEE
ncbi:GatB/YqeY domain-containing protein [Candidatus Parcubacteria bacterium]|nr:MAG: GatB/YqeY domain-containing protein [Candidatus Parcubacteria bacterium]